MPPAITYSGEINRALRSGGILSRAALTKHLASHGLKNATRTKAVLKAVLKTGFVRTENSSYILGASALYDMSDEEKAAYEETLCLAKDGRELKATAKVEGRARADAQYALNFKKARREPTGLSRGTMAMLTACKELK